LTRENRLYQKVYLLRNKKHGALAAKGEFEMNTFKRTIATAVAAILLIAAIPLSALADGAKFPQHVSFGMAPTIDADDYHIFAIKTNGELWAIGHWPEHSVSSPVKVLDDCVSVSGHFAVKTDGTVWRVDWLRRPEEASGSFDVQQVLADIPDIAFVYADWIASQVLVITENKTMYRYEYNNWVIDVNGRNPKFSARKMWQSAD
jgi:alpha-tubulin suppressor-like RCC1 family protein